MTNDNKSGTYGKVKIAFLMCVEKGFLESQSLLLIRSLRKFGGGMKDAPVYCFSPRIWMPLEEKTIAEMEKLEVNYIDHNLNKLFPQFPRTNKIFVNAWAEENIDADFLVFLDSDTIFLNEPSKLILNESDDIGICPVHKKGISSRGEGDSKEAYWQEAYQICGSQVPPFVKTVVSETKIRGHWNSGLISARREAGIFSQWKENINKLINARHFPPVRQKQGRQGIGIPFLDQIALTAVLANRPDKIYHLPSNYNYNMKIRPSMNPRDSSLCLDDIVHLHYHQCFSEPEFLQDIEPKLNSETTRYRWLNDQLPLN
jgi:lipopolysaccharide biosynthesis glycosyltransferase